MTFTPIQTNQRPLKEKLLQRVWEVARLVLCYPTPFFMRKWRRCVTAIFARVGGGWRNINNYASIARDCRIDYPWNVSIGELSSIGSGAWVYALDKIAPGTANDDTLLYGVEVKFYNMDVEIDENLETTSKGLYVIGDCSGVTHSLSHASASGVYAARHILAQA